MNIAEYIILKENEEKFNKVNNFLVEKLLKEKREIAENITNLCLSSFIDEEQITIYKGRIDKINTLIDILNYNKHSLFSISVDEILEAFNIDKFMISVRENFLNEIYSVIK